MSIDYDERARELTVAAVFRGTSGNGVFVHVRRALADVLEAGSASSPALTRAVEDMYADPAAASYLETFERGWLESGDSGLRRCAELIRDTRSDLWESSRDELS